MKEKEHIRLRTATRETVNFLAKQETRSVSGMANILISEAILARDKARAQSIARGIVEASAKAFASKNKKGASK